ncbi:MAG: hypothetical protein O2912_06115 [Proteobacteria bacterium]|nr:hypothetical protein [Pseudomonadota bacterium]
MTASFCAWSVLAQDQQTDVDDPRENLDPLTRAVARNPLTLIRIAALGLKDTAEQGEALNGLVAAFLARNKPDDAAVELKAISDKLWLARALLHVSDDQQKRGRSKTARATLDRALSLAGGDQISRDGGETVRRIATRYLNLKAYQASTNAALTLPDKFERVGFLLQITKSLQDTKVPVLRQDAQKVLGVAFAIAKSIKPDSRDSTDTIIRIAEFQVASGDRADARKTLTVVEEILNRATFDGRDELRADLVVSA